MDIPVWLWFVVGIPGLVLAVAVLAVLWAFRRAGAPPDLDPAAFVHAGRSRGDGPVVVCLGDSITHGKASHPFVETLRQRLPDHTLINAGINGELSYNLLQRVDTVLACEPDAVAILVGTNDATASLMPMKQKKALAKKGLPAPPSVSTYRDWMRDLVTALQRGGVPRIAVLSPPSIAEDVEQPIGRRLAEVAAAARDVAEAPGVTYLPLFEQFQQILAESPVGPRAENDERNVLILWAILQHQLLGRSYDDIGRRFGYHLMADPLHLNGRGAKIVVELIEKWLTGSR